MLFGGLGQRLGTRQTSSPSVLSKIEEKKSLRFEGKIMNSYHSLRERLGLLSSEGEEYCNVVRDICFLVDLLVGELTLPEEFSGVYKLYFGEGD